MICDGLYLYKCCTQPTAKLQRKDTLEEYNSLEHAKPVLLFKRRKNVLWINIIQFYCSIMSLLKMIIASIKIVWYKVRINLFE